jgi:hypothetical protein
VKTEDAVIEGDGVPNLPGAHPVISPDAVS